MSGYRIKLLSLLKIIIMRTKQEIQNRVDSLNERYATVEKILIEVDYPYNEQDLGLELDFLTAEIETLKWVLKLC